MILSLDPSRAAGSSIFYLTHPPFKVLAMKLQVLGPLVESLEGLVDSINVVGHLLLALDQQLKIKSFPRRVAALGDDELEFLGEVGGVGR